MKCNVKLRKHSTLRYKFPWQLPLLHMESLSHFRRWIQWKFFYLSKWRWPEVFPAKCTVRKSHAMCKKASSVPYGLHVQIRLEFFRCLQQLCRSYVKTWWQWLHGNLRNAIFIKVLNTTVGSLLTMFLFCSLQLANGQKYFAEERLRVRQNDYHPNIYLKFHADVLSSLFEVKLTSPSSQTLWLKPVGERWKQTGKASLPHHSQHDRERQPPSAAFSHPPAPPLLWQGSSHQRGWVCLLCLAAKF